MAAFYAFAFTIAILVPAKSPAQEYVAKIEPVVNVTYTGCDRLRLRLSDEGDYLITSADANYESCIWKSSNGALHKKIPGNLIAYASSNRKLLVGNDQGRISAWDINGTSAAYQIDGKLFGIRDGNLFASSGVFRIDDGTLQSDTNLQTMHQLISKMPLSNLRQHITLFSSSLRTAEYCLIDTDNRLRLFDLKSERDRLNFEIQTPSYLKAINCKQGVLVLNQYVPTPDGRFDYKSRLVDFRNRTPDQEVGSRMGIKVLHKVNGHVPDSLLSAIRDGSISKRLTGGAYPSDSELIDAEVGICHERNDEVDSDSKPLVVAIRTSGTVFVSRITNEQIAFQGKVEVESEGGLNAVAASIGGAYIAILVGDRVVIWDSKARRHFNQFLVSAQDTEYVELVGQQDHIIRAFGSACVTPPANNIVKWSVSDASPPEILTPDWQVEVSDAAKAKLAFVGRKFQDCVFGQQAPSWLGRESDVPAFSNPSCQSTRTIHGKELVAFGTQNSVILLESSTGNVVDRIPSKPIGNSLKLRGRERVLLSPDGSLALHQHDTWDEKHGSFYRNYHDGEKPVAVIIDTIRKKQIGEVCCSPDRPMACSNRNIAFVNVDGNLVLIERTNLHDQRVLLTDVETTNYELSEDGSRLFVHKQSSPRSQFLVIDTRDGRTLHDGTEEGVAGSMQISRRFIVSPDRKMYSLANGAFEGSIGINKFDHSGRINFDGSKMVSPQKGCLQILDAKNGNLLASLYDFDHAKDWLVVTPDGYFDGSPGGIKLLSYRVAGTSELIPLERYRKQFEVSALLPKVWKGEDFRKPNALALDLPPTGRILNPKTTDSISGNSLTVTAEATSRGKLPLTKFRLMINDKPVEFNEGIFELESPKQGTATATWDLKDLSPGKYSFTVLSYNDITFHRSEPVVVSVLGGGLIRNELPNLYVLAVGITEYPNDHLDYGASDAEAVSKAFATYSKPLFKTVNVKTLLDQQATDVAIKDALADLRHNMTQNDFGIFYFAGHGHKDNRGKFYLMPINGNKDRLSSTAVDGGLVAEEIAGCPGQTLLILDACHSGSIIGKTRSGDRLAESLIKDLTSEEKSTAVMCSAFGNELAQESREHKHGMFTVGLLEALSGKAAEGLSINRSEGALYFKQIDSYVTLRVKQLSRGQQHAQTIYPRDGFRDFPLSKP